MNRLEKDILRWQKKPSARREDGVFIVEGIKMIQELPRERLRCLVCSDSFMKENRFRISELEKHCVREKKAEFLVVSDQDYARLSDTKSPQGILAVLRAYEYSAEEILQKENGLFVFLENLQDPGNLGTILRSSEAAGADGIILNENSVDPYNPKVIRATMGSFFRMKFAAVKDLPESIRDFRKAGGAVYAAHLSGEKSYDAVSYGGKSAILIGNESKGLSDQVSKEADTLIRIPMAGQVESLNAAMAATIILFEAMRQRRNNP